jgi:hypothetical protein
MSAEAPENQRCLLTPFFSFDLRIRSANMVHRHGSRAVIAADLRRLYFGRLGYRQ